MIPRLKNLSRQIDLSKTLNLNLTNLSRVRTMASSSTSSFNLPNTTPPIPVTHPNSLTQDQLLTFPAFKTWLHTLQRSLSLQHTSPSHPFHSAPYALKSIEIQTVDIFSGDRVGFLKFKADVSNDEGEHLAGSVFMRGGSVAMLIILRSSSSSSRREGEDEGEGEEYAILTVQPRVPAGSLSFVELPAGMIDDSGTFAGAAAKEIEEETGLKISSDELVDLTQLVASTRSPTSNDQDEAEEEKEPLQHAMYPSPGGSDEFIPLFLARKTMPAAEIDALKGKLTGLRDHGEKITLEIVRLQDVWKAAWRDGKALAAMALYMGLRGEGRL